MVDKKEFKIGNVAGNKWFIVRLDEDLRTTMSYLQETERGPMIGKWGDGSTYFASEEKAKKVLKRWLTVNGKQSIIKRMKKRLFG